MGINILNYILTTTAPLLDCYGKLTYIEIMYNPENKWLDKDIVQQERGNSPAQLPGQREAIWLNVKLINVCMMLSYTQVRNFFRKI